MVNINFDGNWALLKARALMLHGMAENNFPISKKVEQTIEAIEKADVGKTIAFLKDYAKIELGANHELEAQMHAIRLENVGALMLPTLNFGRFFEVKTLADNEQAMLRNDHGFETSFRYIGKGNKPRVITCEAYNTNLQVPLEQVATDRVKYPLSDLYAGNLSEIQKRTFNLARDWRNKVEVMAYDLLTNGTASTASAFGGAYGAFVTTGKKTDRSFIELYGRAVSSAKPTTNSIDVGTPSGVTKFSVATLTAIVNYCNLCAFFSDGPLRPTGEIIVTAADIEDIAADLAAPTTLVNDVGAQLLAQGYVGGVSWLGVNWKFTPDNTFDSGYAYPVFNKPVGTMYLKPSQDKDRTKRDDDENFEEAWQIRTMQMVIPWTNRINTARFKYKTV